MAAAFAMSGAAARAGDEAWLGDVIVTARKLPETAATVPLAIDVLGAVAPGGAADSLQGVATRAPGFGYEGMFGTYGIPTLRGQSQPTAAGDNVAVFVDGVYQADRDIIDIEPLDVERIELVRGPQSALFGHSAFAGALNYVSRTPTREPSFGVSVDGGTDDWFGAQGHLSGPIMRGAWLGRLAASYRRADGTLHDASSGRSFGGFERRAIAASLARDADAAEDWTAVLAFRFGAYEATHPAVQRLSGADYNCGSRSTTSGLWSYYCGDPPVARRFDLSDDLPDSMARHAQLSLKLAMPLGALRLESDSSIYRGRSHVIRDIDASDGGQLFGVCMPGRSCPVPGFPAQPVERIATVEQVLEWPTHARELSQELRLRGGDERFSWLIGAVWFQTRLTLATNFAAARGNLGADELYTAFLPGTPDLAGPPSMINFALSDDPSALRDEQFRDRWRRRTLAGYLALDWRPTAALSLRAEFRHSRERFRTRNITAFFAPNPDPDPPAQDFHVNDPRFSVGYAWNDALYTWLSAARGSRSGGINNIPGLAPAEQSFAPEYNWTYEGGLRYTTDGVLRSFAVTGYAIDWRDTQAGSFSSTPGLFAWITTNTTGVTTRGLEASIALAPAPWLRGEFDFSRVDAHFRSGSDSPGLGDFCGLSPTSQQSNFCTIGPPRTASPNLPPLVPWVDGNRLARVPRTSWHAAIILEPQRDLAGWRIALRADLAYQGNMYENQIEALRFGRRRVLDARVSATRGPWAVELWGRNLTDDRYARSAFENDPGLFPTSPVAIDLIHGDGRRIGITLRYSD